MKYVTADEAVKLVRSGDTVACQCGASVPVLLFDVTLFLTVFSLNSQ